MQKSTATAASGATAPESATPQPSRCVLCQVGLQPGASRRVNGQDVCPACAGQVVEELAASKGSALGIVPGLVGGAIGALVGAGIWAAIAILTDYEIGYIAVLVGFLAGHGVRLAARGRGRALQFVAVAMSIVGLLAAKYFLFAHYTIEMLAEQGQQLSYLDPRLAIVFPFALVEIVSPFDLLWIFLAVGAAYRAPAPLAVTIEG
jgi:hypothetical protein